MVQEYGGDLRGIVTLGNGRTERQKVMECTLGLTAIDTRASSSSVSNMVRGFKSLPMETFTKDTMKTVSPMERGNIFGVMGVHIRDSFDRVCVVGRGCGGNLIIRVRILMRESL